jgi:hypothetical protein
MTQKRSYSAGSFELAIDGHPTDAYIRSVEGGHAKASLVDEPIGSSSERIRHVSTFEYEPFSLDIGLSGAEPVLRWIQASWRRDYSRRNGQITHADFDLHQKFEHEFHEALISEVTFPQLDGASKESGYLKLKIAPETSTWRKTSTTDRVTGRVGPKQKLWLCNAFRLSIDGLNDLQYTNKIDSFTIKQGIKNHYTGATRYPTIEPTKIEFPSITGSIALEYADALLQWHDKYLHKGWADPSAQKTGSLEFLKPDRKEAIFRINLYEIGLTSVQFPKQTANAGEIKRVSFELYVGRMDLDSGASGFGS